MLIKKDIIIKGEIVDIMQTLQNLGDTNINELIIKTKEINEKYKIVLAHFIHPKIVNEEKEKKKFSFDINTIDGIKIFFLQI